MNHNVHVTKDDECLHALVRNSSNVREMHYNLEDSFLDVKFQKRNEEQSRVHRYFAVPKTVFDAAVEAESVGKFLIENVINIYSSERIDE